SPTIYSGQQARASIKLENLSPAGSAPAARLYLRHYTARDKLAIVHGPAAKSAAGKSTLIEWTIPDIDGLPVAEVGIELSSTQGVSGRLKIDYLTWDGEPDVTFRRPTAGGDWWRRAFVEGFTSLQGWGSVGPNDQMTMIHNE